jgi:hypothetical protein
MHDVLDTLKKLPSMCAATDPQGAPVLLKRGVAGYWPLRPGFDVDGFNQRHGVTSRQVQAMEIGSIFGWDAPGADPDHDINNHSKP